MEEKADGALWKDDDTKNKIQFFELYLEEQRASGRETPTLCFPIPKVIFS
jgi:hypothetical protein